MKTVSVDDKSLTLSLDANENTKAVYPFDFNLVVKYTLEGNTLKLDASVTNTGNEVLPFAFGTHPGFTLPMDEGKDIGDYYIQFDGIDKAEIFPLVNSCFVSPTGEEYPLPEGKYFLEEKELYERSTVIFKNTKNSCTLKTEGGKRAIKMTWSDDFPYFCFWKTENNGAKFICLEPWSGVPNDGDTDEVFEEKPFMIRLEPGESHKFNYTISFVY
jgi:galactose mutarotase-like enzyme